MPEPHRQVIGVDIGGTGLKLGRFDSDGQLLAEHRCPTPQPPAPGAVTTAVVEAIEVLDPQRQADAVGVGLPGPMDRSGRVAQV
ncbi:MAG: ROK family protein, partial [Synechococcus sp.]